MDRRRFLKLLLASSVVATAPEVVALAARDPESYPRDFIVQALLDGRWLDIGDLVSVAVQHDVVNVELGGRFRRIRTGGGTISIEVTSDKLNERLGAEFYGASPIDLRVGVDGNNLVHIRTHMMEFDVGANGNQSLSARMLFQGYIGSIVAMR